MTKLIDFLEASDIITNYEGSRESLLLLVAKSHQESCTDIHAFIWRHCVSYRPLDSINLGFEFLIPYYADNIEDLGDWRGHPSIISLDASIGCHQIRVRECDQERIALFTPSRTKKTNKVLPFVPTNTLAFTLL